MPSWAYGNSGTRFKVFGTPGHARARVEEKIADAATVHRFTGLAPTRRAAHPVGPGRRLRARCAAYAEDLGVAPRHDQQQHLPGRRLQARQPDPRRPDDPAEGDRPPPRVHRRHEPDRVARPEDLARRRHQLPGPGRHAGPAGPAGRGARDDLRAASATTSGWCWSTSSSSRRSTTPTCPDWGTSYAHVRGARRAGGGLPRHRPPRARAPTSSSSSRSCCGSGSSARSTSTAASTPTTT